VVSTCELVGCCSLINLAPVRQGVHRPHITSPHHISHHQRTTYRGIMFPGYEVQYKKLIKYQIRAEGGSGSHTSNSDIDDDRSDGGLSLDGDNGHPW
jgi:hypothetical protein